MYLKLSLIFFLIFGGLSPVWAQEDNSQDFFQDNSQENSQENSQGNTQSNPAPKPPEITVETNVVQIILNDEHRGGVDWGAIVSDFNTALLRKDNDPLWNDKRYRLSFGTLTEDDYEVLLDALDMAGEVSQFPQAPVKVTIGTRASVSFQKQNIHVDLMLSRLRSGELSLHVVPHLDVAATELFNGEKIPSTIDLQAQTNILVADDTTIVIGGFMKEEQIKRTRKFPLLGNIPIVGLVFRSRGRLMQKTETVVFLTMRTNAVEAPEDEEQEGI